MSANFSLNNSGDISIGTSNLNYLLGSVHEEKLRTFTPGMVHSVFGPGDEQQAATTGAKTCLGRGTWSG